MTLEQKHTGDSDDQAPVWLGFPTLAQSEEELFGPLSSLSESLEVTEAVTEDVHRLEYLLAQTRLLLAMLQVPETEEVPDVFDLRPLSRRRAVARVKRRGPARFYFVADDEELEVED